MRIVLLDGALANQMTQYIFARCLELEHNEEVLLDDSFFFLKHNELAESLAGQEKHGYQLRKFKNAKPHLLSEYFDKDVWKELISQAAAKPALLGGSHMPQVLKDNGLDFFVVAECANFQFDGFISYMPFYNYIPEMLKAQGTVYYHGYFTHTGWFKLHEELFRRELEFKPLWESEDILLAEDIQRHYSVGIHIRRGGYAVIGLSMPEEYYKESIKKVLKNFRSKKNLHFYIFSDDVDYCKTHAEEMGFDKIAGRITYGRDNRSEINNQCDMQLMSLCDGLVLSRSVYCYFAALLSNNTNQWVINPLKSRGEL